MNVKPSHSFLVNAQKGKDQYSASNSPLNEPSAYTYNACSSKAYTKSKVYQGGSPKSEKIIIKAFHSLY